MVLEQPRALVIMHRNQSLHHKNAVIDTDTEYKGGYHNVDEIKRQPENSHPTLYHVPAEEHRHEGQQGQENIPEGEEQHHQHEDGGNEQCCIEIAANQRDHIAGVVERIDHQRVRHPRDTLIHLGLLFRIHLNSVENQEFAIVLLDKVAQQPFRHNLRFVEVSGFEFAFHHTFERFENVRGHIVVLSRFLHSDHSLRNFCRSPITLPRLDTTLLLLLRLEQHRHRGRILRKHPRTTQ